MEEHETLYTFRVAVGIPALQSVLTGIFSAVALGGLSLSLWREHAGALFIAGGGLAAGLCWLSLLGEWRVRAGGERAPEALYEPEVQESPVVRVELRQERSLQFIDLPARAEQLQQLASGLEHGAPFSESAWCGSGRPFSKPEFHRLRLELIKRGLLFMRNSDAPSQGYAFSVAGVHVLKALASGR